jgi:hypothetical protein
MRDFVHVAPTRGQAVLGTLVAMSKVEEGLKPSITPFALGCGCSGIRGCQQ